MSGRKMDIESLSRNVSTLAVYGIKTLMESQESAKNNER